MRKLVKESLNESLAFSRWRTLKSYVDSRMRELDDIIAKDEDDEGAKTRLEELSYVEEYMEGDEGF